MLVYGFADGRVLRDDTGAIARLQQVARTAIASYHVSPAERDAIFHWLHAARVKIRAAQAGGDPLKAALVTATTSWKVLEGLWAVNGLPIPPVGAVLFHRHDLTHLPDAANTLFDHLFLGDTQERNGATLTLIDWLLFTPR